MIRRLSLAVEMLNDPAVLIVDEVTSGLDAATAHNVMLRLKAISESGRTVILTLHQPRSDIYHLLDNVIVLAKGGRTVYAGLRKQVESTFASQGYTIPAYFNPADFLLDVVSIDSRPLYEGQSRERVGKLVSYWKSEEEKRGHVEGGNTMDENGHPEPVIVQEDRLTPMWIAVPVLLERTLRNMWRQQSSTTVCRALPTVLPEAEQRTFGWTRSYRVLPATCWVNAVSGSVQLGGNLPG